MDKFRLNQVRLSGDLPADSFIKASFDDLADKLALRSWLTEFNTNKQFGELPVSYRDNDLFIQANQLPSWADERMMKIGTDFFATHAEPIMNLLGLLSLPYCYTAANGAMVLYLSEKIRTDTGKRLFDTAGFVWDVLSPDAFTANGKGFAAILKVRLMHAAARYYTLAGGKWNPEWGYPVNQEDMAGTNLSFSLIVIRGLRKFGLTVSHAEQQAYVHLWNVIGYLLGLHNELLPHTAKIAYQLEAAIRERHFRMSEQGRALTASLTSHLFKLNTGNYYSNSEILQMMRYLLGNDVADMLGIAAGDLSRRKIRLLEIRSFMQGMVPLNNPRVAYQEGYIRFKQYGQLNT